MAGGQSVARHVGQPILFRRPAFSLVPRTRRDSAPFTHDLQLVDPGQSFASWTISDFAPFAFGGRPILRAALTSWCLMQKQLRRIFQPLISQPIEALGLASSSTESSEPQGNLAQIDFILLF